MNKPVIICVDDELSILKSLKAELKAAFGNEYQIEIAESGEEVLEFLEELLEEGYEIPLIIADYLMPGMKGDELLRLVHVSSPKTLKIMLTGQATLEGISNAIKYAKLYRYISKPWESEDLRLTVIEALNSYIQDRTIEEKNHRLKELNYKQGELIDKLCRNEERLKQFLEAMPVGVLVVNAEGFPYYINSLAKGLLCQGGVDWENPQKTRDIYQIYLAGTEEPYPLEKSIIQPALRGENATADDLEIHQNYQTLCLEVWAKPIYDESGEITYAIAVFQDITQRKNAEKVLEDYSRTLEIQVQERTIALEQVNIELRRLATLDSLTKVANRRRFDECLSQEWRRMLLIQQPLSLILCDVDYFKLYNDYYGHQGGDICLQQVAQGLRRAMKHPADLVARYGGEEFAIILPATDGEESLETAERICQEIQKLQILHEGSSVSRYVTLSLGISSVIPSHVLSPHRLIQAADQGLYEAKKQGRNRFIFKEISP